MCHIDLKLLYCTFIVSHPATGRFYIGVGATKDILSKEYVGCKQLRGTILRDLRSVDPRIIDPTSSGAWLADKAEKNGWKTEIVQTYNLPGLAAIAKLELVEEFKDDALIINKDDIKKLKPFITYIPITPENKRRGNKYKHYCYIYFDNETPIYVGKGQNERAVWHWENCDKGGGNTELLLHLSRLKQANENPTITIYKNLTKAEAFALETKYIKQFGRLNINTGPLYNKNDGNVSYSHDD